MSIGTLVRDKKILKARLGCVGGRGTSTDVLKMTSMKGHLPKKTCSYKNERRATTPLPTPLGEYQQQPEHNNTACGKNTPAIGNAQHYRHVDVNFGLQREFLLNA